MRKSIKKYKLLFYKLINITSNNKYVFFIPLEFLSQEDYNIIINDIRLNNNLSFWHLSSKLNLFIKKDKLYNSCGICLLVYTNDDILGLNWGLKNAHYLDFFLFKSKFLISSFFFKLIKKDYLSLNFLLLRHRYLIPQQFIFFLLSHFKLLSNKLLFLNKN